MKYLFYLICIIFGSNVWSQTQKQYKCSEMLSQNEIEVIKTGSFDDYSIEDLDLIARVTTFIHDSNPEKESYDCFFNLRKKDFLILDVFGLEDINKIDKTVCGLTSDKKINLPKKTIILFHKYINGFEDGGIFLGLIVK